MRIIAFTILVLALSFPAIAQDGITEGVSIYKFEAGFFVAIVAGVILAAAFQLFLTNLSGAVGLSAAKVVTGSPSRSSRKSGKKDNPGHGGNPGNPTAISAATDQAYSAMRKISAGFGLMTMVTASIALFFATLLALKIVGPVSIGYSVIVALVIWGVSYLITFSLELSAGTTMVGAIAYVAKQSFRSITQATAQLMRKSEGRRQEDRARSITQAVRSELFGHIDLQRQIQDYIHELKPDYTPRDYRKELESLIDRLEVEEFVSTEGGPGGIQEIVRQIRTSGGQMSRENARSAANRLRRIVAEARDEAGKEKARHEKVADAAMRAAGLSPEEAERTRHKMEEFLQHTGKEQLYPEGIKEDLEWLFTDPKEGAEGLRRRISSIDRDTIETILSQREDMSKEEAHEYIDQVWNIMKSIIREARETTEQMEAAAEARKERAANARERALDRVEEYIASLDRPTLDAEAIRHDLEMMFNDPQFAAEDLYNRARHLNREDVMAIVTTNRYISREDAEKTINQIMQVRDQAMERADRMQQEITRRMDQAEQAVMHQADQMRKTAASATWWIFLTAAASGATAGLGGWVSTFPW